jgi:hypothetical protein
MCAKRGKPLEEDIQMKHQWFSIFSAVAPETGEDFTCFFPCVDTDVMNAYILEFSKAFQNKKIILVCDQAGWHRSEDIHIPVNIQIEYLPPHYPKLDPVEKLWDWPRKECSRNKVFETLNDLMDAIQQKHLKMERTKFASLCTCNYL